MASPRQLVNAAFNIHACVSLAVHLISVAVLESINLSIQVNQVELCHVRIALGLALITERKGGRTAYQPEWK